MRHSLLPLFLLVACDGPADVAPVAPVLPPQTAAISSCGGWDYAQKPDPADSSLANWCAAERRTYSHEPGSSHLDIQITRARFNCCTDRSAEVTVADDGTYVLTTRERLLPGDTAVCGCECFFDVDVAVDGVPAGPIPFRLDDGWADDPAATRLATTLAEGAGATTLILDDSPGHWGPCSAL